MIIDPNAVREDGKAGEISVYLVALASGMAGAGYFLLSDKYMKEIHSIKVLSYQFHQFNYSRPRSKIFMF